MVGGTDADERRSVSILSQIGHEITSKKTFRALLLIFVQKRNIIYTIYDNVVTLPYRFKRSGKWL